MTLNIISAIEIVFVILAVPAGGAVLAHALKSASARLEKPIKTASSALLLYFLANWLLLQQPSTTETFLLGLPLGNSPVALVLYTAFAAGTVFGAFSTEIQKKAFKRYSR